MSTRLFKAGAAVAFAAVTGATIAIGGAQIASADSATATTGVNIRSGPGTSYDIVGGLVAGQSISAVGQPDNGWVKVRFNGDSAFVSAEYLDLSNDSVSSTPIQIHTEGIKISTAALNVRTGPSLDAKVNGYISSGQKVTLTGKQSNGFAEVLYGGQRAWVTAQYLVSSSNDLPTAASTKVATADLLIRTSTDADFKIITTVSKGTELKVTGKTRGGYAQIVYNDAARWVTAAYLAADGSVEDAPKSDEPKQDEPKQDRPKKDKPKKDKPKSDEPKQDKPKQDKPKQDQPKQDEPEQLPDIVGKRYATTELLVRTTAGSDYRTVATIDRGDKVKITGTYRNGRAQIVYDGKVRWVTAEYLSKSKPKNDPPADDGDNGGDGDGGGDSGRDDPSYDGDSRDVPNRIWDRLAMCESSGNWSINTGNGFYGGLQFTLQTWRGFGGTGMPHHASRLEQIRIAERVLAVQGWGAWPACTTKLGLR